MSGFIYVQHSIALFQRCVVNKACRLAAHFSLHDSNSTNLLSHRFSLILPVDSLQTKPVFYMILDLSRFLRNFIHKAYKMNEYDELCLKLYTS